MPRTMTTKKLYMLPDHEKANRNSHGNDPKNVFNPSHQQRLDLSTDSESVDFGTAPSQGGWSSMPSGSYGVEGEEDHPDYQLSSKEILAAIAKLTLVSSRENFGKPSSLEVRSSYSSPGKSNVTLREKLSRLSRGERKDLLLSSNSSKSSIQRNLSSSSTTTSAVPDTRNAASSNDECKACDEVDDTYLRTKRQAQYNVKGTLLKSVFTNHVVLNIYDLISKDALMLLPFGCMFEIGKCFSDMNSALHVLGTGAYHVGVQVNGIEYAYGATNAPGKTGVFSCQPKRSPGYQYRTSIDFGDRPLIRRSWVSVRKTDNSGYVYREIEENIDGRQVVKEMVPEYMGIDYDILRKNCCSFARDLCLRLGINDDEIPSWFRNLAESGAATQDMAYATVEPLRLVLSSCEEKVDLDDTGEITGFEVIPKTSGKKEVLLVVDAQHPGWTHDVARYEFRRTNSWTY